MQIRFVVSLSLKLFLFLFFNLVQNHSGFFLSETVLINVKQED